MLLYQKNFSYAFLSVFLTDFFSRITKPISAKLCTNHPYGKNVKKNRMGNRGLSLFQKEDDNKIVKIKCVTSNSSSQQPLHQKYTGCVYREKFLKTVTHGSPEACKFNTEIYRENSFFKNYNATICKITMQAPSDSVHSKLFQSWPLGQ